MVSRDAHSWKQLLTVNYNRLQVRPIVFDTNCQKYGTKEEAINAFDEAMQNGFVEITGPCDGPYKSPRIYPPLTSPPHPIDYAGPNPPNPPKPQAPPASAPAPSVSSSSLHTTPFPSTNPSRSPNSPFDDTNVTMRSPKREKRAVSISDGRTRNAAQSSPTKGECSDISTCNCNCHLKTPSHCLESPIRQRKDSYTVVSSPQRRVKKEPRLLHSVSPRNQVASPPIRWVTSPTPRPRTSPTLQPTPRVSPSGSILRTQSASAVQFSSPLASSSRYFRDPSPSRLGPNIVYVISSDSEDDYPSASESETESSGPEVITPPQSSHLLSPLTTPKLKDAGIMTSGFSVAGSRSPRKKDATNTPTVIPKSRSEVSRRTPGLSYVVGNELEDPRSPIQPGRNRTHIIGETMLVA